MNGSATVCGSYNVDDFSFGVKINNQQTLTEAFFVDIDGFLESGYLAFSDFCSSIFFCISSLNRFLPSVLDQCIITVYMNGMLGLVNVI